MQECIDRDTGEPYTISGIIHCGIYYPYFKLIVREYKMADAGDSDGRTAGNSGMGVLCGIPVSHQSKKSRADTNTMPSPCPRHYIFRYGRHHFHCFATGDQEPDYESFVTLVSSCSDDMVGDICAGGPAGRSVDIPL